MGPVPWDWAQIEDMISTSVTGFAAAVQAAAMLLFTWRIMKTVEQEREQDGEELSQPRPEHAAVAALTAKVPGMAVAPLANGSATVVAMGAPWYSRVLHGTSLRG
eukprot:Skav205511  [mRNA]  locus=scaffold231:193049:194985:- [translate_table: standard]